jgi:antitoxin component YwqK of YwqJK toxin-antitoxin module
MFKSIKNSFILFTLFSFCSCMNNVKKEKSNTNILFFDSLTKSKGLLIDGKKEGVWEYLNENFVIEYKCISDDLLSNKSLFFANINDVFYPLGAKINDKKEGLWLNYEENGLVKNYEVFHLNAKDELPNLETKILFNGKKVVTGSKVSNKKVGMWLSYNDTSIAFINTFDNDTLNGIFITSPLGKNKKISCSCAKNNFLDGQMLETYSYNKISHYGRLKDGKMTGIWEYFDTSGNVIRKIDYTNQSPKIIFGKDSNTLLPPPPPPPSNNKITK